MSEAPHTSDAERSRRGADAYRGLFSKYDGRTLAVGALALVMVLLLAGSMAVSLVRVPLGVSVAGTKLGGASYRDATDRLTAHVRRFSAAAMALNVNGVALKAAPESLGLAVDVDASLAHIENSSWRFILASLFLGREIPLAVRIDEERFTQESAKLFASLEVPAQNATLKPGPSGLELVPSRHGVQVDREALRAQLVERGEHLSSEPIVLSRIPLLPEVTDDEVQDARKDWQRIMAFQPYTLRFGDLSWKLNAQTLTPWIEFIPVTREDGNVVLGIRLNEHEAASFFVTLASVINKDAINAVFGERDGAMVTVRAAEAGRRLNAGATLVNIERALARAHKDVSVVVDHVEPATTSARLQELGISMLIGSGESNFAGSPDNRIHNIKTGSARFNGAVLAPGEEFSFNQLLGPVDAAAGYRPELVIKGTKVIPEYGGGLCQISTTVFRGALDAGLPVLERQNHSFIISYYGKPGADATIYPGYRDFRFRNDTGGHVFLQIRSDGTRLVVEFFGRPNGRTVEVRGPFTYESNPDGSARTVLTRAIKENGAAREEKFYSFYKAKALYAVERNPYE
ncbi:MAG: VanW family protein [Patescibacteria group bacterium]|nr:VanW family protein [Patescibacteria group bacterium]